MLFIYCRVSTDDQDEGSSRAEQEQRCRGVCMARGAQPFDISLFYDKGISGSVPLVDRPQGREMLKSADKGDIIVASKLDRLFRSARDALNVVEDLAERGVGVILVDMGLDVITENGASKLFFSMLAAFAEFERGRINERTVEGRRAKQAKGGFVGGKGAPYGWRVVGVGRDATLELVSEEQEAIKLAQELAVKKLKPYQIIRLLSDRGIRARNGKQFHPMQVTRMIQKEVQHA